MSDTLVAPGAADSSDGDLQGSLEHLSGAQKAAIVLLKLGRERSAKILRMLPEHELTRVTAEIVQAQSIKRNEVDASLIELATIARANDQLATGGIGRARDLLEASLGHEQADEIMASMQASIGRAPFDFLLRIEPRQVVSVLAKEHPQTVAVILAHLLPEQASGLLSGLDADMQRDVSIRLARLELTSPDVIEHLEANLRRRFGAAAMNRSSVDRTDGVQMLIEILNRSDRATEKAIFEGLEEREAQLAEHVRSRMFVFEDIATLDDRSIQLVLRNVETAELAMALKGVRDIVKDKIKNNMSTRAGQNLDEEIMLLGPVRAQNVEEAQGAVVKAIRTLEETGQLVISRGTDEFVE
jgi:flagellar motor switch protein FliG